MSNKNDNVTLVEFFQNLKRLGQWKWFPLLYILFVALVASALHQHLYGG